MATLAIFKFGYYGWGNSTPQLVQAVDAVERARGFKPPIFVDIRIRRAVRATGFNGTAFEKLLGENRHRWMRELGNKHIETRTGPQIQIAQPKVVNDLLDLVVEAAEDRRRIIFFCGCEWPRLGRHVACHRTTVASLALRAAKRRGLKVEIVEWPGGKPGGLDLVVDEKDFKALIGDKWFIPVKGMSLADSAGTAWGSLATINCDGLQLQAVVGPAQFRQKKWQFRVLWHGAGYTKSELQRESNLARKAFGLEPSKSRPTIYDKASFSWDTTLAASVMPSELLAGTPTNYVKLSVITPLGQSASGSKDTSLVAMWRMARHTTSMSITAATTPG